MIDISYSSLSKEEKLKRQKEITMVFLKLGILAFGGPAAHISMMDEEIVQKRKWLTRDKFMDFIGTTNLIPGPNSTEIGLLVGFERGGILGLLNAGISFILPAMIIILLFARAYVLYGSVPQVEAVLYGIKPVIMAIVLQALFRLGRSAIKNKLQLLFALGIGGLYLLGIKEIPLLMIAGILMSVILNMDRLRDKFLSFSLPLIFLTFLKIGSVLYGSGYVLLAFLEAEFIKKYNVLTYRQILDSIAIGQFTPGPVFTTATFIGYLLEGTLGAILATIGIFLPAFLIVLILNPIIPKLRESKWIGNALDGINIASLILMAIVSIKLGITSIIDILTVVIFISSLFTIIKLRINSAWVIIAGGIIGLISSII